MKKYVLFCMYFQYNSTCNCLIEDVNFSYFLRIVDNSVFVRGDFGRARKTGVADPTGSGLEHETYMKIC
jgi:hypothetical protein